MIADTTVFMGGVMAKTQMGVVVVVSLNDGRKIRFNFYEGKFHQEFVDTEKTDWRSTRPISYEAIINRNRKVKK